MALVRTDNSEERIASIIRLKHISELGTTLATIVFLRSVFQVLVTVNVRFVVFTAVTMKNAVLRRVAIVRTDVSEECSESIIRVTIIGELGRLAVSCNRRTLRRNS
jgi:demethoxyubiquinone hydroxylase (CLK1/Coq7/Cat5 family)